MVPGFSGENLSYLVVLKSRKLGDGKGPIPTIIGREITRERGEDVFTSFHCHL